MQINLFFASILFYFFVKADEEINTREQTEPNSLKRCEFSFLGGSFAKIIGKVAASGVMKAVQAAGKVAAKKIITGVVKAGAGVAKQQAKQHIARALKRR